MHHQSIFYSSIHNCYQLHSSFCSLLMKSFSKQSLKASFSTLSNLLSPIERMAHDSIQQNFLKNITSKKIVNNVLIGLNCTSIALKYSKCYLCKFPVINQTIRLMNKMNFVDETVAETSDKIFRDVSVCDIKFPEEMKWFRKMGKYFKYQNRNVFSAFSLLFTNQFTVSQREKALKFLTAVESITLGFELHYNIGSRCFLMKANYRPNTLVEIGLKIVQKVIKDKYLVLAGDYFHIRASVLGAETRKIYISKLLAEIEINLCKWVYLQEQLKKKITQKGYGSITLEQIHQINVLQAKQIAQGLMGIDSIKGQDPVKNQQLYNCIGLMIMYRKQLQNFMFNFYKIFGKYLEYTKNMKMNFCDEYTLTNYLFYQSAQQNQRIDLAYLNTVQLMSDEIQYLERRIKAMIADTQQGDKVMKKINYIMMMHS